MASLNKQRARCAVVLAAEQLCFRPEPEELPTLAITDGWNWSRSYSNRESSCVIAVTSSQEGIAACLQDTGPVPAGRPTVRKEASALALWLSLRACLKRLKAVKALGELMRKCKV